jgi:hypothetical protein
VDDSEASDLVAFAQHIADGVGRSLPEANDQPADERTPGSDGLRALHLLDVFSVTGQRDLMGLADFLRSSLVIRVDVRQGEHAELASCELLQDPTPVPPSAGVDQNVSDQVDVDDRSWALRESPHPVRELLHHNLHTLGYPYFTVSIPWRTIDRWPRRQNGD